MINVPTLKADILAAFTAAFANITDDPATVQDQVADAIAQACADAIKRGIDSATITITNVPALVSPAGPVTGTVSSTATITTTL